ncbi:unnamed protein product [Brassica rapa]|uniref:Uncharacterized protein n=1 Tax=Brassica campestris TaxID=3711 RepID=A0A3P6CXL1_BRACM|nr:unnamed protein product [Brassica rapa]VDD15205.1 unnamed protein product [Brassica rapa]
MSSVCGKLDFKGAGFEISASSPTRCSDGSKLSSHAGSDESQESDGDETGYINQTGDDELALESLSLKSSYDEENDENLTTTTPVILIPAIKGSREKHGLLLRKTSVTWADDVYDPPPSIASHTRHKKPQQQKSKSKDSSHRKTGKKGQKNKDSSSSSRGGKNKKQASRKQHSCEKFDWVTQMPIVAASS